MNPSVINAIQHLAGQIASAGMENALVCQNILETHMWVVAPNVSLILNAQEIELVLTKSVLILVQEFVHKMLYVM